MAVTTVTTVTTLFQFSFKQLFFPIYFHFVILFFFVLISLKGCYGCYMPDLSILRLLQGCYKVVTFIYFSIDIIKR